MVVTCIIILCTAVDHPTGLIAEQLPKDSGSFRVLWTPPASSANLTGYRIYYSGANDSGSVDVDAFATNITIGSRIPGVTYNITMVALSPHLPSPVIGLATVTPGERFVSTGNSENSDCDGPKYNIVTYDAFKKYNNILMYLN